MLTQFQDNIAQEKRLKVKVAGKEITPATAIPVPYNKPPSVSESERLEARYMKVETDRILARRARKSLGNPF